MSEEKKLALPGNGYDVIAKVLQAYVLSGGAEKPLSLDAVASRAGIHSTQVSRNTGFLVSVGLLTEGKSKALTPDGKALAIALRNKVEEDISNAWKRAILNSPSVRSVIDMISIRGEVEKDSLPGRIASTLGIASSDTSRVGLNTLIDIFKKAGLIEEVEGKYSLIPDALAEPSGGGANVANEVSPLGEAASGGGSSGNVRSVKPVVGQTGGSVAPPSSNFNVHVHISSDSSPEQVDAIFASIAKHLYGGAANAPAQGDAEELSSSIETAGGED